MCLKEKHVAGVFIRSKAAAAPVSLASAEREGIWR